MIGEIYQKLNLIKEDFINFLSLLKKQEKVTLHLSIWLLNIKIKKNMLLKHFLNKELIKKKMENNL